jgi:hypothetical protein
MMALGVAAEQHDEADLGQEREQTTLPERCALRPRRQITAGAPTGIAQTLRQDRHALRVVEGRAVQAEPEAERVAAAIGEGYAAQMGDPAGCLAREQDARTRADLQDRPRPERFGQNRGEIAQRESSSRPGTSS